VARAARETRPALVRAARARAQERAGRDPPSRCRPRLAFALAAFWIGAHGP